MGNLHAAKIYNLVSFSRLATNTKVRLFQTYQVVIDKSEVLRKMKKQGLPPTR